MAAVPCEVCGEPTRDRSRVCQRMAECRSARTLAAESAFRARLAELGAEFLEAVWLGARTPHRVRCAAGHECQPRPDHVRAGHGVCQICAGNAPATAEAAFRDRLAELGATLLEQVYLGANRPHHVACAAGHDCWPRPSRVQQGGGVCRVCAGKDPAAAEAAFRARLDELGATPLYEQYLGVNDPHHVRCAMGHDCYVHPAQVRDGSGVCRTCAGKTWDVFYVLMHETELRVKFGVTSGDPRPRLAAHRAAGYGAVVRLVAELPGTMAPDTERAVKSALAMAGERPVRGTEYFDVSCLGLILDVADSWLPAAPLTASVA